MKRTTRLLALFLVLALLVQILPFAALADDLAGGQDLLTTEAEELPQYEQAEQHVLGEMADRRGESEKHFRMSNGSFVAVDYGMPVHFTTDDGATWEDIDNTLTLTRGDADLYVAENGDSVRSFAPDLGSGQLFSVANGAYSLRMGLPSDADNVTSGTRNSSSAAEISYPDEKTRGEELSFAEQITPEKLRADVLYRDVYDGVDLSYTLYSYNVKETILVKERLDSYAFPFILDAEGLTPVLLEDGSIELRNEAGEAVYLIPAPYMVDADGTESTAVSYALNKTASGSWTLTVTANADWIDDESRAFPVAIDPTVYFAWTGSDNQIFSGYINSKKPNGHPSDSANFVRCGFYPGSDTTDGYNIGYVYVNKLPSIPENCVVTTSMLKLFQAYYSSDEQESDGQGGLQYKYCNFPYLYSSQIIDSSFDSSNPLTFLNSLTWNNRSSKIYYGGGTSLSNRTALDYTKCRYDYMGDHYFEITETTRKWYNGDDDISRLLVLDDGQVTTDSTRASFSGYGHNLFGHRPQLVVFYRNTVGVEGCYDYHTQNIGRAGTASVNNFTLGLSLSVPVFSAPSQALPFGLALTYNSPLSDASFTDSGSLHTKDYTTSGTGYGWKTSVQQSVDVIQLTGNTGSDKKWLVYTDGDGTEHYFSKDPDSSTKYEDEDGLGLTITVNSASNPTEFTMKDKETNTWKFLYGYLSSYTDHNGNALYYAYNGYDYSSGNSNWKPSSANTVYRVTSVWRQNSGATAATKLVTLNYTNDRLGSVVDMASRSTAFTYNNAGNLTTITYPDGQTATYTYSNATVTDPQTGTSKTFHRLKKARDDEAQYEIRYTYWSAVAPRVKEIKEYTGPTGSETAGTILRGHKSSATTTVFRYCGADNTLQTGDDLIVHYYFDNWGRPINVTTFDTDDSGEDIQNILGVSAGTYTPNKDTNKDNNRLTHAASGGLQSVNLVYNSGIEHVTNSTADLYGWTAQGNGAAAAKAASETTPEITPRTGAYMMKLYLGSVSAGQESCYQTVYLTAGETYVFSGYVNTAAVSNTGTVGAYLSFRTSSGTDITSASSRILNYKTNTAVDNGWERLEAVYTPTQSGTYQVAVNLSHMAKVVLADDLQLEQVTNAGGLEDEASASSANLIQFGSFESTAGVTIDNTEDPPFWEFSTGTENNQTVKRVTIEQDNDHGNVIRLDNAPNRQVCATQEVQLNAPSNRTYLLSGWGKIPVGYTSSGNDLKYNNATYERFFGFIVEIHYAGISEIEYQYVAFNGNLGDWQYTTGVIAPKRANKTVEKLVVKIRGDLLPNDSWVDDVSLVQEPVQTYTYDEKGNLTAATNSEGKTSTELDNKDRLTKYTAMNGVVYDLHYADSTTRSPEYITSDGVKTSYEYDNSGGVTKTTVQNGSGKKLVSETSYDGKKNFAVSSTDANGSTVRSNYDGTKGTLEKSWDPKGTKTHYHYDADNDRATLTYISGIDALNYQYDGRGRLEQLDRGSYNGSAEFHQAYHFDYDIWGNTESIRVWDTSSGTAPTASNSTELAGYEYNTNGTLSQMSYPNGDYVLYSYDLLDRLIEEVYYDSNDTVQADYRYVYNANGQLARQYVVKTENGNETVIESYTFEYDSLGRLIRSREEGGSGLVQRTEHLYDQANRLTAQNWSIGKKGFHEEYSYNDGTPGLEDGDGSLDHVSLATGDTVSYHYDDLKRADAVTVKNGSNVTLLTRSLSYQDFANDSTRTTSRLGEYTVKGASNNVIVQNRYEYDANGNITKIEEAYSANNTVAYRDLAVFVYDSLNQLEYETRYTYANVTDTPATTTVIHYTIDTAGNIRSVETTINNVSSGTVTYTYDNPTWADLLTAYDGHAIAYEGQSCDALTGTVTGTVASGNPINWYNGNSYTDLNWEQGRRLESITRGSDTYSYEYDMSGIRTVKIADSLRHEYVTQNGKVVRETVTNASTGAFVRCLDFFYDENGKPFAMRKYRDSSITSYDTFHYVTNAQGDVVQLNFQGGTVYAEYTYDAWGKLLSSSGSLADMNPLRYRGYYYDIETGFYYLQSRYYDPILGRFINTDCYASTAQGFIGYNMFAYCNNSPVNTTDPAGYVCCSILDEPGMLGGSGHSDPEPKTAAETVSEITRKEKYSQANWDSYYNNLDVDGLYSFVVDYTTEVGAAMNIGSIPVVCFVNEPNICGCYIDEYRVLCISVYILHDRSEVLTTIRHELRHCYQHDTVRDFQRDPSSYYLGSSAETVLTVIAWSDNFLPGHYIRSGPQYYTQPVEADAFHWERISG